VIEWQVKEFGQEATKVDLFVLNINLTRRFQPVQDISEAITNVARHSKATNLLVEINEQSKT
jgi:signal transduction histidine kinase